MGTIVIGVKMASANLRATSSRLYLSSEHHEVQIDGDVKPWRCRTETGTHTRIMHELLHGSYAHTSKPCLCRPRRNPQRTNAAVTKAKKNQQIGRKTTIIQHSSAKTA
jgi:hypothetical protein